MNCRLTRCIRGSRAGRLRRLTTRRRDTCIWVTPRSAPGSNVRCAAELACLINGQVPTETPILVMGPAAGTDTIDLDGRWPPSCSDRSPAWARSGSLSGRGNGVPCVGTWHARCSRTVSSSSGRHRHPAAAVDEPTVPVRRVGLVAGVGVHRDGSARLEPQPWHLEAVTGGVLQCPAPQHAIEPLPLLMRLQAARETSTG